MTVSSPRQWDTPGPGPSAITPTTRWPVSPPAQGRTGSGSRRREEHASSTPTFTGPGRAGRCRRGSPAVTGAVGGGPSGRWTPHAPEERVAVGRPVRLMTNVSNGIRDGPELESPPGRYPNSGPVRGDRAPPRRPSRGRAPEWRVPRGDRNPGPTSGAPGGREGPDDHDGRGQIGSGPHRLGSGSKCRPRTGDVRRSPFPARLRAGGGSARFLPSPRCHFRGRNRHGRVGSRDGLPRRHAPRAAGNPDLMTEVDIPRG